MSQDEIKHPIDREKPEIKDGEFLCGVCWKVGDMALTRKESWMFFRFKFLSSLWLCGECKHVHAADLVLKQERGL